MKNFAILTLFFLSVFQGVAQTTKRVLFIGNSYTAVNNLPQMVADVAAGFGDILIFDSNVPGGVTFQGHTTSPATQAKINQGNWDFVVLQEQSQLPAFPYGQFASDCLPYAQILCQQIRAADSCTRPMFYLTWGRKNGDQANCAFYPPLCTYAGMQGQLRERYLLMADTNFAEVAPVGAAWRDLRASNSNIELYQTDESHPSLAGSYLAACTFYASIFRKSPIGAAIPPAISAAHAQAIQQQAYQTVFDSLPVWHLDTAAPKVLFSAYPSFVNCEVDFDASASAGVDSIVWDFGDGTPKVSGFLASHLYISFGTYTVKAIGFRGCESDSFSLNISPCIGNISENELRGISVFPNPTKDVLRVSQFGQSATRLRYVLTNIQGQLILAGTDASEIYVGHIPAGFYVLNLQGDGALTQQKVLIE